jgi:rod shape-determining protein MreC
MFNREMGLVARFTVYALLSLGLLVLDTRYQAIDNLRSTVNSVLDPLQGAIARPFDWLDEIDRFLVKHVDLVQTNARLSQERTLLHALQQGRQTLQAENERLRQLLALPRTAQVEMLAAEIVRTTPDPFSRKVIISLGASHGVETGLAVIDADGLIGQVTQVSALTAEVTLITDQKQGAPVQDLRNGARVIVSGTGADSLLEIRFLDLHSDLKPGDLLYTSGIDGQWPAGIPVATVMHTEPPRHTPFARAWCRPLGKVGQYRHVLVLKPQRKAAS